MIHAALAELVSSCSRLPLALSFAAMLIRVLQVLAIVITAAILWGVRVLYMRAADLGGTPFVLGLLSGVFLTFIVFGLIMWIDPSSRPRGRATEKQSSHDGI